MNLGASKEQIGIGDARPIHVWAITGSLKVHSQVSMRLANRRSNMGLPLSLIPMSHHRKLFCVSIVSITFCLAGAGLRGAFVGSIGDFHLASVCIVVGQMHFGVAGWIMADLNFKLRIIGIADEFAEEAVGAIHLQVIVADGEVGPVP
jgi:hypothetical protein